MEEPDFGVWDDEFWPPEPAPQRGFKKMKIKLGLRGLPATILSTRCDSLVENGTDNPNVPGNSALVTALKTENDKLKAATGKLATLTAETKETRAVIKSLLASTQKAAKNLAALTESVTDGEEAAVLSAGFDLRLPAAPVQPVEQVQNLKAELNGKAGVSKLSWDVDPNAVMYLIEATDDPTDPTKWKEVAKVTESKAAINGAVVGKKCWFRVAAFNKLGQGPWSNEASRPVL